MAARREGKLYLEQIGLPRRRLSFLRWGLSPIMLFLPLSIISAYQVHVSGTFYTWDNGILVPLKLAREIRYMGGPWAPGEMPMEMATATSSSPTIRPM